MKLKKPYSNKEYADLAVYCNENGMMIEDKGDYLESVNLPKTNDEELQNRKRWERNAELEKVMARVERYQTQKVAGLETTETSETVEALLLYAQYLRDFPQQGGEWWNAPILTFEEWGAAQ